MSKNKIEKDSKALCPDRIDVLAKLICDTSLGRPVIDFGVMMDVQILLRDDMETTSYYHQPVLGDPEIWLNAKCSNELLTVALAHELRHVEQMVTLQKTPHDFSVLNAVLLTRVLEADASAFSVGVAYEISQKTKNDKILDALALDGEEDIRDVFLSKVVPDKKLSEDPEPFCAAFDQWFQKQDVVDFYDENTIDLYGRAKNDFLFCIFHSKASPLTAKILGKIGSLSENCNYLTQTGRIQKLLKSEQYKGHMCDSVTQKIKNFKSLSYC